MPISVCGRSIHSCFFLQETHNCGDANGTPLAFYCKCNHVHYLVSMVLLMKCIDTIFTFLHFFFFTFFVNTMQSIYNFRKWQYKNLQYKNNEELAQTKSWPCLLYYSDIDIELQWFLPLRFLCLLYCRLARAIVSITDTETSLWPDKLFLLPPSWTIWPRYSPCLHGDRSTGPILFYRATYMPFVSSVLNTFMTPTTHPHGG